jgi:hypothetical protein
MTTVTSPTTSHDAHLTSPVMPEVRSRAPRVARLLFALGRSTDSKASPVLLSDRDLHKEVVDGRPIRRTGPRPGGPAQRRRASCCPTR